MSHRDRYRERSHDRDRDGYSSRHHSSRRSGSRSRDDYDSRRSRRFLFFLTVQELYLRFFFYSLDEEVELQIDIIHEEMIVNVKEIEKGKGKEKGMVKEEGNQDLLKTNHHEKSKFYFYF